MSGKVLSLDISNSGLDTIDLASMLPLSDVNAIHHRRSADMLDDIFIEREDVYIFEVPTITLTRFRTLQTLDVALPSLIATERAQKQLSEKKPRERYINLVKPLYVPYGALDVRSLKGATSEKKRFDLYTRSLSRSLMIKRQIKAGKRFLKRNQKGMISVVATVFILTVPLLWYVKSSLESGYTTLLTLPEAKNIEQAKSIIASSRASFERAHFLFAPYTWIPFSEVDLARRATDGGLSLTRAADLLLSIVPTGSGGVTKQPSTSESITPMYRAEAEDIYLLEKYGIQNPTDWIRQHRDDLTTVHGLLERSADLYTNTDDTGEKAQKMKQVGTTLGQATQYLKWYLDHDEDILKMLGDGNPARYIVLNQNRDEIRANGGFPGTVISFTLYKGNILDYRKDDVYYYDWNLYPYKEQPPPGLALLSDNYGLRDVNYYPDFHKTLEKANSFIERSGDPTITTGIAIHQGIIEDILDGIGPVTVSGVTIPFDSDNFSLLMSTLVEAQYGRDLHAKTILFDFVNAFIAKINTTKRYDVVFKVLEKYWHDGEILVASRDSSVDAFLSPYRKPLPWESDNVGSSMGEVGSTGTGVSGRSSLSMTGNSVSDLQTSNFKLQTYLRNWAYPVFTSVGGNKSDRYIERTYTSKTQKKEGCLYENTITITNKNTFSQAYKKQIQSYIKEFGITDATIQNKLDFVEGNSPNKAFVRVYVPIGSKLVTDGGGIETLMGDTATAFAFNLETPVNASASKTIRYTTEIPHCVDFTGSVNWYRQPGLRKVEMR